MGATAGWAQRCTHVWAFELARRAGLGRRLLRRGRRGRVGDTGRLAGRGTQGWHGDLFLLRARGRLRDGLLALRVQVQDLVADVWGKGGITGENSICDYVNGKKNVITVLVSQTDVYRWLVKGLY